VASLPSFLPSSYQVRKKQQQENIRAAAPEQITKQPPSKVAISNNTNSNGNDSFFSVLFCSAEDALFRYQATSVVSCNFENTCLCGFPSRW